MKTDRRLWTALALVLITTFSILGFFGREVYRQAPPIPERIVTGSGRVLLTRDDILTGQQVWQSIGGQQVGSIWGHGAYQAPDWSADWLHREATSLLALWSAREHAVAVADLAAPDRAALEGRLREEMRGNTYDAGSGTLVVSEDRASAMAETARHYRALFGGDPALHALRDDYAMRETSVEGAEKLRQLAAFFFWTSWACTTERPGSDTTYTNNWPHEPLVGNRPSSANLLWSLLSIAVLLAGIGGLVAFHAARAEKDADEAATPRQDPLDGIEITPSMRATAKYCAVVILLFVVQVLLGALTAHYTVEGQHFFGLPLGEILPYSLTRTWHLQTALFWIATAFLAAGLFLAPAIGGREPRFQRLGVNLLFGALLLVVAGSLAGEWLAIQQWIDLDLSFWLGHQGYEYVELGRIWQIGLFAGLLLWLVLMLRGLWPALTRKTEHRQITLLFAGSAAAIGLFYGAGFFYGARTHLTVMEYWRWWVVHLWVEGFMEVFATAAIAFLFSKLGLVKPRSASRAVLLSTSIFLVGGIPGTFHHLYFSGTPISIMAIGACFSALEVVPLVMVGFEALATLRMQDRASWMERYRWPIRFFVGVSFWNLVGAGVFGFLINPPIALYYMQGLNTTPVHAHTALFGVYGLLALGLVLVVLRRLAPAGEWREGPLAFAFWSMNGGLVLMVGLSLLPIGLLQTLASIETGLWFARSAEFLQQAHIQDLRWLRLVGDTVFLAGVGSLAWFVLGLRTGWSYRRDAAWSGSHSPAVPRST
ncbi:MAG: nitric oxide reductase large subunit [Deltaproteobacteria bacterium]|nr:nitric oxide reductase large subunit [Deltaproteobacteria bacterium]